jgi:hypothetical protein
MNRVESHTIAVPIKADFDGSGKLKIFPKNNIDHHSITSSSRRPGRTE